MNISLEGKTAIVCGSSRGIGFAVASELALLGAHCILLARSEENLRMAVSQLDTSLRQRHQYHMVDFSDEKATTSIINSIVAKGPVHILVNNSGGPAAGPITEASPEQFLKAFHQHLVTSHLLTQAVMEGMKQEGYGRIINIISTSVKIPLKNLGVSNTTRGAVASWAKTMANELGGFGITVNNILPGLTRTSRLDSLISSSAQKEQKPIATVEKNLMAEIPAGRFGEAAEIAAVAAFLATPAAAYVNGTSLPVDGGRTGSL